MLGKTNINTLSEGAIVTEIEDFSWVQMQTGTYENFYKVIAENGYLAAITRNGTVAYSTDGEVWQIHQMEYTDCKLNDIAWDGDKFILVGSYADQDTSGLVLTTTDFKTYKKISNNIDTDEYYTVYPLNGKYILVSRRSDYIYLETTDFSKAERTILLDECGDTHTVKNNSGFMVYDHYYLNSSKNHNRILVYTNDQKNQILNENTTNEISDISVFECKNSLYYMILTANKCKLVKVSNYGENFIMSEGQNFAFVDGVYYAGCEIFINNTSILVVKPGENIADKAVDDLKEIAPEFTLNCITKAFDNLYIFGNRGVILKSSAETNNEGAIAVQALSAKKALAEAKAYTDEQIAILREQIEALEAVKK